MARGFNISVGAATVDDINEETIAAEVQANGLLSAVESQALLPAGVAAATILAKAFPGGPFLINFHGVDHTTEKGEESDLSVTVTTLYTTAEIISTPPVTATVKFSSEGGTPESPDTVANVGASIILPTPALAGSVFAGWFSTAEGGTFLGSAGSTYTVAGDALLYAQWTADGTPPPGGTPPNGAVAPQIHSAADATFAVGVEEEFEVRTSGIADGAPLTLSVSGTLPVGVLFQDNGDGTGTFYGAASAVGTSSLTINADNGVSPVASQAFTLTVA
jgi:hypothetical protein